MLAVFLLGDSALAQLRVPPHLIEAWSSPVPGGCCSTNQAWDLMGDLATDSDFYRDEHRRIFRQIRNLLESRGRLDVVGRRSSRRRRRRRSDRWAGLSWENLLRTRCFGCKISGVTPIVRERLSCANWSPRPTKLSRRCAEPAWAGC
ncbi:MAG: hypothetical protein IPP03_19530 [Dechloromonas sp.]|nr:hypothetical protein [Candidatus Dechloromonas phosphoritropha]